MMIRKMMKTVINNNQKNKEKKNKKKPLTQNKSFKKNLLNRNFIKQKNII